MVNAHIKIATSQQQGTQTIVVVVEKAENNWCAFTPDDVGVVVATGATREATVEEFRSALRFHLDSMRQEGLPVPDVRELEVRELIAA